MSNYPGAPTAIRAPHGAMVFELNWPGGQIDKLPHRILRGYCPCAGCQGHSGKISFQAGHRLELRELSPVGNYALGLTWGDGHDSGIYTFQYLYRLGRLLSEYGEAELEALGELPAES